MRHSETTRQRRTAAVPRAAAGPSGCPAAGDPGGRSARGGCCAVGATPPHLIIEFCEINGQQRGHFAKLNTGGTWYVLTTHPKNTPLVAKWPNNRFWDRLLVREVLRGSPGGERSLAVERDRPRIGVPCSPHGASLPSMVPPSQDYFIIEVCPCPFNRHTSIGSVPRKANPR